jgi:hypothetical protein
VNEDDENLLFELVCLSKSKLSGFHYIKIPFETVVMFEQHVDEEIPVYTGFAKFCRRQNKQPVI